MDGEVVNYNQPSVPTAEYLTQAYPASERNGNGKTKVYNEVDLPTGSFEFRLEDLAYTRSGDKGNDCNIGEAHLVQHNIC